MIRGMAQAAPAWLGRVARSRKALWLVTAAFVVLGCIASLKTPLYQGSDEGWHYAYVEHYALGRPLVNLNKHFLSGDPAAPYWQTHEAAQPPLYYILMGRLVAPIPRGDVMQEQVLEGDVPNGMYGNFLPADTGGLGSGLALAGHVVRFVTVLMGALVVIGSYGVVWLITARAELALVAAAITAFNPRNIVLSAQISNDMAVAAAAALTLLLATNIVVRAGTARAGWLSVLLGAGAGLTLLMKYSGGAIVPAAALALLCRAWRLKLSWRWLMAQWALFGVGALLVTGWYFAHNWQLYGDILAWNRVQELMPVRETLRPWDETLSWVPFILQTQFAHPAYTMALASGYTRLMVPVWLLSMLGVLWLMWHRRAQAKSDFWLTLPLWVALAINLITFVPWLRQHDGTQSMRFFSPSFVPITALFVLGLVAFLPRRAWAGVAVLLSAAYGLFSAVTLWQGFNLMYAFPQYVTGAERDALIQRDYPGRVMFENGIELLDAQLTQHRLEAGQPIALTLVWRTTRPLTQSAHLMLDVRDENGQTIAALNTGNAVRYSYVPKAWQVGEPVRERYLLDAPVTHSQIVRVLAGWSSHGPTPVLLRPINNPSVSVEVARAKIRVPTTSSPPNAAEPAIARIVGLADLLSAQAQGDEIVLRWRATAEPEQNYTVFVHGLDPQGQIVTQNDVAFGYSAVYWNSGEEFEQHIPLKERDKAAVLKIGVYDPNSLQRLPAQTSQGQPLAEDSIVIGP